MHSFLIKQFINNNNKNQASENVSERNAFEVQSSSRFNFFSLGSTHGSAAASNEYNLNQIIHKQCRK